MEVFGAAVTVLRPRPLFRHCAAWALSLASDRHLHEVLAYPRLALSNSLSHNLKRYPTLSHFVSIFIMLSPRSRPHPIPPTLSPSPFLGRKGLRIAHAPAKAVAAPQATRA